MPTSQEIWETLCAESGPISSQDLAKKMGVKRNNIFTQMERMVKTGNLSKDDAGLFSTTDLKPVVSIKETPAESNEELETTEFDQFKGLGKKVGVSANLITLTADHVWNGGDFKDLRWVQKAMAEMGIRQELTARWLNSWRTNLQRQGVAINDVPAPALGADGKISNGTTQERDYSLDENDLPVYAGVGNGDMSRAEAMELAKIRARKAVLTNQGNVSNPVEMLSQLMAVVQNMEAFRNGGAQRPSYVVRPTEDGSYQVEEVPEGRPMVIGTPHAPNGNGKKTYIVDAQGGVQEVEAGQPIIIKQNNNGTPPGQAAKHFMVDKQTGEVQEISAGQPIVIVQQPAYHPAPQQPTLTPIQLTGPDGKPITMDLSTYIKLEEFKSDERRKDETHKSKQELVGTFKDFLKKAANAAEHVMSQAPAPASPKETNE